MARTLAIHVYIGPAVELELRLRRFDGAYRWFICRACPETDASERVLRWCGINSDIDDRRRRDESDLRTIETNSADGSKASPVSW